MDRYLAKKSTSPSTAQRRTHPEGGGSPHSALNQACMHACTASVRACWFACIACCTHCPTGHSSCSLHTQYGGIRGVSPSALRGKPYQRKFSVSSSIYTHTPTHIPFLAVELKRCAHATPRIIATNDETEIAQRLRVDETEIGYR